MGIVIDMAVAARRLRARTSPRPAPAPPPVLKRYVAHFSIEMTLDAADDTAAALVLTDAHFNATHALVTATAPEGRGRVVQVNWTPAQLHEVGRLKPRRRKKR